MFSLAISVAACLRAGTDVVVAWIVGSEGLPDLDPTDAVAITSGGGRIGSLANGAFDSHLASAAVGGSGRVMTIELAPTDALIAGLPIGGRATLAAVPARTFPAEVWDHLRARRSVAIDATLDDGRVTSLAVHLGGDDTPADVGELLDAGRSTHRLSDRRLLTVLAPVPRLVVSGGGPNAEALANAARLLGWQLAVTAEVDTAVGLLVGLSPLDAAVIMGHDVESAGRALEAALESGAGYIGALGAPRMQQLRADWLAYRGITDLSRVHGPAGLDIAARTPAEIALSVLAEAVSVLNCNDTSVNTAAPSS